MTKCVKWLMPATDGCDWLPVCSAPNMAGILCAHATNEASLFSKPHSKDKRIFRNHRKVGVESEKDFTVLSGAKETMP
jgi:hypothetical protein